MPPAGFFELPNPVVAARRSTQLFVHHLAQNGAVPAHHISQRYPSRRNDAVLDDFDEVFDYYFNKLTQTRFAYNEPGSSN